jgi:hypothetical protein
MLVKDKGEVGPCWIILLSPRMNLGGDKSQTSAPFVEKLAQVMDDDVDMTKTQIGLPAGGCRIVTHSSRSILPGFLCRTEVLVVLVQGSSITHGVKMMMRQNESIIIVPYVPLAMY